MERVEPPPPLHARCRLWRHRPDSPDDPQPPPQDSEGDLPLCIPTGDAAVQPAHGRDAGGCRQTVYVKHVGWCCCAAFPCLACWWML